MNVRKIHYIAFHFRGPHSHYFKEPSPANPCEYPHKPYFARNCDRSATLLSLIVWLYLHLFFVVSSKRHVCNATERIIVVRGHFRVIQGRWFWYQSKARIWFHIINSNLGPILHRFGDTAVYWSKNRQNRQFIPTPVSEIALARGDPYRILWWARYF